MIKEIPDFPGYYVSDQGEVFSCWRSSRQGRHRVEQKDMRPLKISLDSSGYPKVRLSRDGKSPTRNVHRLVLEAFVGPRAEGQECRHLDGCPENNRLDNLAWGTPAENEADKIGHGTDKPRAKLTEGAAAEIRRLLALGTLKQSEIAERFGVSQSSVSLIHLGTIWRQPQHA